MAALALGACGGDEVDVQVPRTVPDLTVPTTAEPAPGEDAEGATEEQPGEAAPDAAQDGATETAPETTPEAAPDAGAEAPSGEGPQAGAANADAGEARDTPAAGEYDAFCDQNPGACPS